MIGTTSIIRGMLLNVQPSFRLNCDLSSSAECKSPVSTVQFLKKCLLDDPVDPPKTCLNGSYAFAQRDGYKSPTEDRIAVLSIDTDTALFGVFDGHGGSYVSDYVSSVLPSMVKEAVLAFKASMSPSISERDYNARLESILEESFLATDDELLQNKFFSGGSTGTVALATLTSVVVANLGDSPCIAFSKHDGRRLLHETVDHTPKNKDEVRRIESNGGTVTNSFDGSERIDGNLSITRAFGHRKYKVGIHEAKRIITAKPQT